MTTETTPDYQVNMRDPLISSLPPITPCKDLLRHLPSLLTCRERHHLFRLWEFPHCPSHVSLLQRPSSPNHRAPPPPRGVGPLPESLPHLPRDQQPGRHPPHQARGPLELEVLAQHGTCLPLPMPSLAGIFPPPPRPLAGPEEAVTGR